MNKGIKETRSDTKRNKNVSKIATRIIGEKKRSPTRGKERSSSMNSLVPREESAQSPKKIVQKEPKSKIQGKGESSEISSIKTEEEIENPQDQKMTKINQKQKLFDELIAREGSIEKLLQIKKNAKTVYNVDGMSAAQIRESLTRVDDETPKPFSFLNGIVDHSEENKPTMTRDAKDQELNPTEIDLKLSSLVKRVELNRTLLERANQRVRDINFLAERNRMISIRDMSYDEESFLNIKDAGVISKKPVSAADLAPVSHPAVEELQKTMNSTIEMLGYVHKMSTGDLASGEIPPELMDYLNMPITGRENP